MHAVAMPPASTDAAVRAPVAPKVPSSSARRDLDSRTLFAGATEVRIEHFGQEYRLRQTRNGKLILTK